MAFEGPFVQWFRTPAFHAGNTGSNPVGVTLKAYRFGMPFFVPFLGRSFWGVVFFLNKIIQVKASRASDLSFSIRNVWL